MELTVNVNGYVELRKVYNPICLVADKQTIHITMRDGGFEIIHKGQLLEIKSEKNSLKYDLLVFLAGISKDALLVDRLATLYKKEPLAVAKVCDECLDLTGRLLGIVRTKARTITIKPGEKNGP